MLIVEGVVFIETKTPLKLHFAIVDDLIAGTATVGNKCQKKRPYRRNTSFRALAPHGTFPCSTPACARDSQRAAVRKQYGAVLFVKAFVTVFITVHIEHITLALPYAVMLSFVHDKDSVQSTWSKCKSHGQAPGRYPR